MGTPQLEGTLTGGDAPAGSVKAVYLRVCTISRLFRSTNVKRPMYMGRHCDNKTPRGLHVAHGNFGAVTKGMMECVCIQECEGTATESSKMPIKDPLP